MLLCRPRVERVARDSTPGLCIQQVGLSLVGGAVQVALQPVRHVHRGHLQVRKVTCV